MDQKPNLPEQIRNMRTKLEICHCPRCMAGEEAPHEYHLERRPMPSNYVCAACKTPLALGYTCHACGSDEADDAPVASAALSAPPAQEPAEEHPAEEALRSLACWLGVGGYNAPTVDARLYEQKIREGVTVYSQLHGLAARDLAETVLHMDLITPKGIRARELARQVLGIVPLPQEPQEVKALTDDLMELARQYAHAYFNHHTAEGSSGDMLGKTRATLRAALERELRGAQEVKALQPLTEEQCNQIADCAFAFFDVPPRERDEGLARYIIQLTTEALSAERELRGAQEVKAGECVSVQDEVLAALRGAEEWLSGWASAEPYLSRIRAAIARATGVKP